MGKVGKILEEGNPGNLNITVPRQVRTCALHVILVKSPIWYKSVNKKK